MNAYELADKLNQSNSNGLMCDEAANMLRQQADRIALLEAEISNRTWVRKLLTEEKQSEPVAWMSRNKCIQWADEEADLPNWTDFYVIPLYTTPQTKPLSDEEIEELREYHGINEWMYETSVVDFARAIEAKVRGEK